jgi:pyruvate/2-oxoglutarate/acetoin dehydrogenase E1 component
MMPVSKANVARRVEDVTVIAHGLMIHETLRAAE